MFLTKLAPLETKCIILINDEASRGKKVYGTTVTKNFPKLISDTKLQIQEV